MSTIDQIKREVDARAKDEADARAILDAAAAENRDPSPEEEQRFDAFVASADKRKSHIAALKKLDEDAAYASEVRHMLGDQSVADTEEKTDFDSRLIAAINDSKRAYKINHQTTTDLTVEAFVNLEKRAIADFSDSGALYTTDFATKVAVYQRTVSPWINLASVINADNGRPINLPNLTADPTSYTPGEGTAITEATPTIGSAALTTTAYKALSYVSQEAEEDELVGLLDYIARSQGRSIGLKFGSALTASLLTAMNNGGTAGGLGGLGTGTAAFFGWEDLIDLKFGRQAPYRSSGVWVMANGAIKKVRKFRDAQGAYFWQPATTVGGPDLIDGNPVYEDPFLATPASATKSVVFGDASAVIVKQMALRVATSAEFLFSTDQVALKTVYRAGGALPDATALAYLVSANT